MLKKNTGIISWGQPAQIADSKERFACGKCGSKQGIYGKHFGIGQDGNPVPVDRHRAFDITLTKHSLSAKCWNCTFSFYQVLSDNPEVPTKVNKKPKKKAEKKRN